VGGLGSGSYYRFGSKDRVEECLCLRVMEYVPAPLVDAQAIAMLSGHPDSDEFIEVYRTWRTSYGIVEALQRTGDEFRMRHREG
jgi:hypothetical protein